MKIKEDFENWNEEMAKKYNPDKYHQSSNFIIKFIENKRTSKIIKYLNLESQDKIIEIGCGAGNIMEKIKIGRELWGIDISDFMLKLSRQRKYHLPVKLIKANVENLPGKVKEKNFDKIYCSEVLEHVQNPERVLAQIKGISKKTSIIVISVPNEELINQIKNFLQKVRVFNFLFPNISKKMDDEWHLNNFDLNKLRKLVSQDYIIQKIKGIPYNWLPLRYIVKMIIK
ncbi:MAG: class I SAM-dependent methyltransferase [Patescibacteria group bacterium]|nr:class I SAM-dependent methyltransferase [Patescibacteria group bacterium]MBU2472880.1 class I SAM-dependent methyltransferase [Patescibacteria group bacterium]